MRAILVLAMATIALALASCGTSGSSTTCAGSGGTSVNGACCWQTPTGQFCLQ